MKTIRKILVGTIVGGAFGSKVGAYFHTLMETPSSLIYGGLILGAGCGLVLMLAMAVMNKKIQKPIVQIGFKKRFQRKHIWNI